MKQQKTATKATEERGTLLKETEKKVRKIGREKKEGYGDIILHVLLQVFCKANTKMGLNMQGFY